MIWELLTDPLARYYWLKQWYGDTVGIVEYLAQWVQEYSTPEDTRKIGILCVILLAMVIGWKWKELVRKPIKGETIADLFKKDRKE